MNYDDRIRRTRQASLVSSACAATLESMAMRPLCASICRATGQDAGTSGIADNSLTLNFTNDSGILQRGGVRAGIYSKLFNFQEVVGRNFSSCGHSLLKNHTIHTVSPPCGNALAETFILSPEPCHARQCCARRFPGLFVSNKEQINHT